jgi:UDP-N-acetylmuramyl-tripeptide synthetase
VINEALAQAKAPPGRFESIDEGQRFLVIVDYAHTPDGLEKVLLTAKKIAKAKKGKLITVFGCGGDRDREKRGKMGFIVSQFTDFFIITSDNPRTENQQQITADILSGINENVTNFVVEEDRARAIRQAIDLAGENDVVVLAGKGHETYQILNTGRIHFDDREEARNAILTRVQQTV